MKQDLKEHQHQINGSYEQRYTHPPPLLVFTKAAKRNWGMLRGVFRSTNMSLKLQGAALAQCRRLSVLLCCPSFVINTEVRRGGGGRERLPGAGGWERDVLCDSISYSGCDGFFMANRRLLKVNRNPQSPGGCVYGNRA